MGNGIIEKEKLCLFTQEEIQQILSKRGLSLKNDVYISSKAKMHCVDAEGYEYALTLDNIKDKRTKNFAKYSSRNPYTLNNLKLFIAKNNLECILLTNHNPSSEKEKLEFLCKCGKHYWLAYNHLLVTLKDTCNSCGRKRDSKYSFGYTSALLAQRGYKLVDKENFSYRSICVQDRHGYKYKTSIPNLLHGGSLLRFHKLNPFTIENMKIFLQLNNVPVDLLENNNRPTEVRTDYLHFTCAECKNTFLATWGQVMYGRIRCDKCCDRQSNLAYMVEQYLITKQVKYIKEYRFDDCRNKKPLPFDFYLPEQNYAIEVQGGQHFAENAMFAQSLEERQRIDAIKAKYCETNNIGYVAIPWWWIQNNHNKKRYKNIIDNIIG